MKSHFFTSPETFTQTPDQAFGIVNENVFRLTSLFSTTAPVKAFSVCKGVVLVQPQSGAENENRVNLILRPFTQPFAGLNIKYFIYRGLQKVDFFNSQGNILATGSEFITKINADYDAFYAENPTGENGQPVTKPPFSPLFIGFDPNVADQSALLSDYFFKNSVIADTGENQPFELPMIDMGKWLGNFSMGECGIDVVLNYGDYKHDFDNGDFVFDLNYARLPEAKITLSGTAFEKKLLREQITQFLDIASFYGLFVKEGTVTTQNAFGEKADKKGSAIYSEAIYNLSTKNNWYVYIQSDRTRSYNFYGNYKIAEVNSNNLKIGITENVSESKYETQGWPVLINIQTTASDDDANNLFLQLVTDNNTDTVLYGQVGTVENAQQNNFCNADNLRLPADEQGNYGRFTKIIKLTAPAVNGHNIASISLLIYQGIAYEYEAGTAFDEDENLVVVMAKPNFFDDVFDLISSKPLLVSSGSNQFSKMSSEKLGLINQYFDNKQQGLSAVQTLTVNDLIETGIQNVPEVARVTYITETADVMSNSISTVSSLTTDTKTSTSAGGTISKSKTYQLPEPYYYDLRLFTDGVNSIMGLELKTLNDSLPNKILLGLTKEENDSIKEQIPPDGSLTNPRLFLVDLFEDGNEFISPENISYQKYKVGIVAEDLNDEGKLKLFLPATEIFVYSIDRRYHFSKGYSEYVKTKEKQSKVEEDDFSIQPIIL